MSIGVERVDQHRVAAVGDRGQRLQRQVGGRLGRPVPHRAVEATHRYDGLGPAERTGIARVASPLKRMIVKCLQQHEIVDGRVLLGKLAAPRILADYRIEIVAEDPLRMAALGDGTRLFQKAMQYPAAPARTAARPRYPSEAAPECSGLSPPGTPAGSSRSGTPPRPPSRQCRGRCRTHRIAAKPHATAPGSSRGRENSGRERGNGPCRKRGRTSLRVALAPVWMMIHHPGVQSHTVRPRTRSPSRAMAA